MDTIYLKWPITSKCPLDCKFCNNKITRKEWPKEVDEIEINDFINFINKSPYVSGITITGGEPTYSSNFINVCSKIKKPFGFITSGYNLYDLKFKNIFNNKNLKFITLSMDCLKPGTVGEIRGSNILDNQLKSLNLLIEYKKRTPKFKIFINTVVTKQNYNSIKNLIIKFGEIGVDRIQLFKFHTTGNEQLDKMLQLSFDEEKEVSEEIIKLFIEKEKKWEEKKFELSIRFLPPLGNHYWEKKFNRSLPFTSKNCGVKRNSIYLKTDTRLNLCNAYYRDDKWRYIKNSKISELDLEHIVNTLLINTKSEISNLNNYKYLNPCSKCKLLLKPCNPCMELSRTNSVLINMQGCLNYLELLEYDFKY